LKNIYLLKDLSKISGYSTHALKFYLRLGLLKEIGRSPETKFRYFDDSSCERLKQIRDLQKKKRSLKEIGHQLIEDEKKSELSSIRRKNSHK
jgi:DNA-binding transcriptional MerR regulator